MVRGERRRGGYLFEFDGVLGEVNGLEGGALDEVGALNHAVNGFGVVDTSRSKL